MGVRGQPGVSLVTGAQGTLRNSLRSLVSGVSWSTPRRCILTDDMLQSKKGWCLNLNLCVQCTHPLSCNLGYLGNLRIQSWYSITLFFRWFGNQNTNQTFIQHRLRINPSVKLHYSSKASLDRGDTKQLCPIPANTPHHLLFPARMEGKICSDIIYLPIDCHPCIIPPSMLFQF